MEVQLLLRRIVAVVPQKEVEGRFLTRLSFSAASQFICSFFHNMILYFFHSEVFLDQYETDK